MRKPGGIREANGVSLFLLPSLQTFHGYRGITFGRAGFCTGTGDGLLVVEEYTRLKPHNPLSKYLPTLKKAKGSNVSGLGGFEKVVRSLANNSDFRAAQDTIADKLYYQPALAYSKKVGASWPITKGQMWDAMIQHGDGSDWTSMGGIVKATNRAAGGTVAQGVDEATWLKAFLATRRSVLKRYDALWADSVVRVDIYSTLLRAGDIGLNGPIYVGLTRKSSGGWLINNAYYGKFLIYNTPGNTTAPVEKTLQIN